MTPEEKLLRAIFGEKASDVRDTSLRLPPGTTGTIVEVRVFNRHGVDKDERAIAIEREEIERLGEDRDDELAILERNIFGRLQEILIGKIRCLGAERLQEGRSHRRGAGRRADQPVVEDRPGRRRRPWAELEALKKQYDESKARLDRRFEDKVEKLQRGDEMPPGVMKMVKVFVAVKRKLQPGDKMAGRHGNKGVISKINADRGHAVPGRRDPGRHRAEPARRAVADECRPDPGNPSGLGL
jgi:DNA-directed RNA polymerase subunit beta